MFAKLLSEIQRRRVLPVLATYAVVGWVIIQVLSIIPEAIGLSSWILTVVSVVYIALFPVVIFVAWFFDIDAEGIKLTPGVKDAPPSKVGKIYWFGFTVALSVSLVSIFYGFDFAQQQNKLSPKQSVQQIKATGIAVLPFQDVSATQDQSYLSRGLAEEITSQLGRLTTLRVSSFFSASRLADSYSDPIQIASALGVNVLLRGKVRQTGDRVRLDVELYDATVGAISWSQTFTRAISDIFAIKEETSRSVVNLLIDTKLASDAFQNDSKTTSTDAYQFYLRAKELLAQRTIESVKQARILFEQSLGFDPEFSDAQVGLAQTLIVLAKYPEGLGVLDLNVALSLARSDLEKALGKSPELAEAHATLGRVLALEAKHEEALVLYEQAIFYNQNSALAYVWKYLSEKALQNYIDASKTLAQAYQLDPANKLVLYNYARQQYLEGDSILAAKLYRDLNSLYPQSPLGHRGLAEIAFANGDLAQSAIQWKQAVDKSPESVDYKDALISILFQVGATDIAQQYINGNDWDVNLLLSKGQYEQAFDLMDFKMKARPDDPWVLYEAAWYQLLYGDVDLGSDLLIEAHALLSNDSLYYPPLCNPGIDIAFSYANKGNTETANHMLQQCQSLVASLNNAGQESEATYYLSARIAMLEGKPEQATEFLVKSIDMGWREHWTANDPILRPLYERPEIKFKLNTIRTELGLAKRQIEANFNQR